MSEFTRERFIKTCPEFAEANEAMRIFAEHCRYNYAYNHFFRLVRDPYEIERWDELGGYDPKKSMWGRFVGTYNEYLPWLVEELEYAPPWIERGIALFEFTGYYEITPVKYTLAVLGAPLFKIWGATTRDVYVSVKDLLLAENYCYEFIPIESIKKIYLNPKASEKDKQVVRDFASKHNIEVVDGFPEPSGRLRWALETLAKYLMKRHETCIDFYSPPRDVVGAALAETYDEYVFRATPIGASDALLALIKRSTPEKMPWRNYGQVKESCYTVKCGEEGVLTYKCVKCGRTVRKPYGNYYCKFCGPTAIMVQV